MPFKNTKYMSYFYLIFPLWNSCFSEVQKVLKFLGNYIEQKQNIENLPGYAHWVLVTLLENLNPIKA